MKNRPAPEDLPLRARCGYVLKYGNVKQGEITAATVAGILHAKRLTEGREYDEVKQVAQEVLEQRRGDGS